MSLYRIFVKVHTCAYRCTQVQEDFPRYFSRTGGEYGKVSCQPDLCVRRASLADPGPHA